MLLIFYCHPSYYHIHCHHWGCCLPYVLSSPLLLVPLLSSSVWAWPDILLITSCVVSESACRKCNLYDFLPVCPSLVRNKVFSDKLELFSRRRLAVCSWNFVIGYTTSDNTARQTITVTFIKLLLYLTNLKRNEHILFHIIAAAEQKNNWAKLTCKVDKVQTSKSQEVN